MPIAWPIYLICLVSYIYILTESKQLSSGSLCYAQVFAGFSGHDNSIYNIIPLLKKKWYNIEFISFVIIRQDSEELGRVAMANMLHCNIGGDEFKTKSCYYLHFQTNTLGKGMKPLILLAMG